MHIRKGDQVIVISGPNKEKRGKVLRVFPETQRAIVEGVNLRKKHAKPNPRMGIKGGIIEREMPIHISNLMLIDPSTQKPTRVGHKFIGSEAAKQKKVRIARATGAELDR